MRSDGVAFWAFTGAAPSIEEKADTVNANRLIFCGPIFHGSVHPPRRKPWSHLMGALGVRGSNGSPSNAWEKPFRGIETATEAPEWRL